MASFRLNAIAAGGPLTAAGAARGFHAGNIGLHGLVCAALVPVYRRLLDGSQQPRQRALLGAATFAVHPVHTEAIANVAGRAELLSALAVLLCFLCFPAAGGPPPQPAVAWLRHGGCAVLLLTATLAKGPSTCTHTSAATC